MKVKIKRFNKKHPLPKYKTEGAVAFDLHVREDTEIPAGKVGHVPLNVAIEIPVGHFVMLSARSSLHKRGLMLANGVGIVDADFCGDDDEYVAACYNFTSSPVKVVSGERIAQGVLAKVEKVREWEEVEKMNAKTRGGLGTTGRF